MGERRLLELTDPVRQQLAGATHELYLGADGDPQWRPVPRVDGTLQQDPGFSLPTAAGPLAWNLYHESDEASQDSEWGYGCKASFPLRLVSDGSTVTVMHEDSTTRQYRASGNPGDYYPAGANYDVLEQNDDGSWDETLWETGVKYHYPAGSVVSVAYRETPQGLRLWYQPYHHVYVVFGPGTS